MTYSTISAPSYAGNSIRNAAASATRGLAAFFDGIGRAIVANSTAHRRLAQAERLQERTDAELAAINLRREDIPRYVFRDLFWN